jgi:hypothetical protein
VEQRLPKAPKSPVADLCLGRADKGGDVPRSTKDRTRKGPDASLKGRATRHPAPLVGILLKGDSVIRRIVSVLVVSAILLATVVAPAFADDDEPISDSTQTVDVIVLSGDNSTTTITLTANQTTTTTVNNPTP